MSEKTFEPNCEECRGLTREWINQDREFFVNQTRDMIRHEFSTRKDIIEDIRIIKREVLIGKILIAINSAAILFIIFKLL